MIQIALLLLALLLSSGIGRTVLRPLQIDPGSRLERHVCATTIGLGVLAYLVFALGMAGLLSRAPVLIGLALLALLSSRGLIDTIRDLSPAGNPSQPDAAARPRHSRSLRIAVGAVLLLVGFIVLVACFVPPGGHEWDALSYHLAAPKIYIERHRIIYLPTQHQATFPFLMEMLFTLGLLFNGYALANLFHFATGALCVGAILGIGRRHFGPRAATIAALSFAITPLVIWEAGIAYIDVGQALFVLTAVGATLKYLRYREPGYLLLAGILMGFALAVKTLSLIPFVLTAAGLLAARARPQDLLRYVGLALVIGCPFYVRTWAWTGNPVYPFAYRLFPHSVNWDKTRADAYATEHTGFGQNRRELTTVSQDTQLQRPPYEPPSLADSVRNLLYEPFGLVALPRIFYNANDFSQRSQLGFLFLALPPLALLAGHCSRAARWSAALAGAWFLIWSLTMQYVRYLIPVLPLLLLVGAEGVRRMAARTRAIGWLAGAAIALQASLALAFYAPRLFAQGSLPGMLQIATDPAVRENYLQRAMNIYESEEWINQHAPPNAGVIIYEDSRGFYLDRPYLWGNSLHSLYIPYQQFTTGREMADWFLSHGYQYALINLQFFPGPDVARQEQELNEAIRDGTIGTLVQQWYDPKIQQTERWRALLGDAIFSGAAIFHPEASFRGAAVLEFRRAAGSQSRKTPGAPIETLGNATARHPERSEGPASRPLKRRSFAPLRMTEAAGLVSAEGARAGASVHAAS